MKKKIFSVLFALVLLCSLGLVTAAPVSAGTSLEGTTCQIVGDYYPVNFTVTDDGPTVTWTFDMIGGKELSDQDKTSGGRWNYGLAISLDGEKPAFQIHNNDGTTKEFPVGTHLYSPYIEGWKSSDTNTPVANLGWVTCTGDAYISPGDHYTEGFPPVLDCAGNPEGMFTVTIDKAELGLEFYWAIWCTAGGFWEIGGYSSYPDGFMWGEDVAAGHYEPCSLPANLDVGLVADVEAITAINVSPTSIDFGTITPGTTVSGTSINVNNIGTETVAVNAYLEPTSEVFAGLSLNTVPRPNAGAWSPGDLGMSAIVPTTGVSCTTALTVPSTYSAKGVETATLIFIATPK